MLVIRFIIFCLIFMISINAFGDNLCCENKDSGNNINDDISLRLKRKSVVEFQYNDDIINAFNIWRREYTKPTVCGMVFCTDNCAKTDKPCPSFNPKIVFFSTYLGYLNGKAPCYVYSLDKLSKSDLNLCNTIK